MTLLTSALMWLPPNKRRKLMKNFLFVSLSVYLLYYGCISKSSNNVTTNNTTYLLNERNDYDGVGNDGTWGTADDVLYRTIVYHYDSNGLLTTEDLYYANGNISQRTWTYDNMNNPVGRIQSSQAQGIQWYATFVSDLPNPGDISELRWNPGPDSQIGSVDDYEIQCRIVAGPIQKIVSKGAGIDTMWCTSDDPIMQYENSTLDSNGNIAYSNIFSTGIDNAVGGNDDIQIEIRVYTYTAQ